MNTKTNAHKTDTDLAARRAKVRWTIVPAFAALGAVAGYFGASLLTDDMDTAFAAITVSQGMALSLGAMLLICMGVIGIGYAIPALGLRMAMFEDREEWRENRAMMGLSAAGAGAWGLVMIGLALAQPLGLVRSVPALSVLALLVLVMVVTSWRLLFEYDELWQGVNSESCTIAFYITALVLALWAGMAQLGFAAGPAPLDAISLVTAASLAGAIYSSQRRGMLTH